MACQALPKVQHKRAYRWLWHAIPWHKNGMLAWYTGTGYDLIHWVGDALVYPYHIIVLWTSDLLRLTHPVELLRTVPGFFVWDCRNQWRPFSMDLASPTSPSKGRTHSHSNTWAVPSATAAFAWIILPYRAEIATSGHLQRVSQWEFKASEQQKISTSTWASAQETLTIAAKKKNNVVHVSACVFFSSYGPRSAVSWAVLVPMDMHGMLSLGTMYHAEPFHAHAVLLACNPKETRMLGKKIARHLKTMCRTEIALKYCIWLLQLLCNDLWSYPPIQV